MLIVRPTIVVLAAVLIVAGCGAADSPPTPGTTAIPLPVSSTMAITAEQLARTDTCGLLDAQAITAAAHAEVQVLPGFSFTTCRATVGTHRSTIDLALTSQVSYAQDKRTSDQHAGVTVYGISGNQPNPYCVRDIVVSPNAAVEVTAAIRDPATPACPIADAAIDSMIPHLVSGQVSAIEAAPNSLAFQDSCRLLTPQETSRVPGIDRTRFYPEFGGQACNWGSIDEQPRVRLTFMRFFPTRPDAAHKKITIGGRDAIVHHLRAREANDKSYTTLPQCDIEVPFRRLDHPGEILTTELVTLTIAAQQSEDANCSTATDLTAAVLARLPAA